MIDRPTLLADQKPLSIAPPSDIVLDVAQAADPLKLQAATAKLARMAAGAGAGGADFDAALTASAPPTTPLPSAFKSSSTLWPTTPAAQPRTASTYQKFEAVLLQNFVQNILPKDQDLFGDASSADIVRTMMAEQLATQLAKSGRIGIARMIQGAHPASGLTKPSDFHVDPPPISPQASIDPAPRALTAAIAVSSAPNIDQIY